MSPIQSIDGPTHMAGPLISLTAAARRKKKARQKYRAGRVPLGSFIRKEGQAGVRSVLPADVRIRPGMAAHRDLRRVVEGH